MSDLIRGDLSQLSEQLRAGLRDFAEFIDADLVEFKDRGNGEELTIYKYGKTYIIKACGNKVDGGFFGYAWGDEKSQAVPRETETVPRPPYIRYGDPKRGVALRQTGANSYYRDGGVWELITYEHEGKLCGKVIGGIPEDTAIVEVFPTTEAEWREDNGKYAPGYKEIAEEDNGTL